MSAGSELYCVVVDVGFYFFLNGKWLKEMYPRRIWKKLAHTSLEGRGHSETVTHGRSVQCDGKGEAVEVGKLGGCQM